MLLLESENDIVIIDSGLAFPDEEMLGIDLVIPDFSYALNKREKIKGIVLTHGHEDHIGSLPYLLKELSNVPVFGTKLTLGLVRSKLKEHGLSLDKGSTIVTAGSDVTIGDFRMEFFRVNHSIPDSVGIGIHTPLGLIVHMGDFKIDHTPVDGEVTDLAKLAQFGKEGVLALLSDSTNANRSGFTPTERNVGESLDEITRTIEGRIIVTTFASNIHRIQQVVDTAVRYDRKVGVIGRSIENTVEVALELGYLKAPAGTIIPIDQLNRMPAEKVIILTTGSQGEPMSALARMSTNDHRQVEIVPGDTVVIAATPVPGNEKSVYRTINNLYKLGANVISGPDSGVHVSGHASQEELKLILSLTKPQYLIPVHGEYRHLAGHADLAESQGIPRENVLIGENGSVFELTKKNGHVTARVNGKVSAEGIMVDGLGVGDVGAVVLRDRRQLSQDGILIVVVTIEKGTGRMLARPEIVTRGFVYVREAEALIKEAQGKVTEAMQQCQEKKITEWATIKNSVRDALGDYLWEKTKRRPMIMPIVMEIDVNGKVK